MSAWFRFPLASPSRPKLVFVSSMASALGMQLSDSDVETGVPDAKVRKTSDLSRLRSSFNLGKASVVWDDKLTDSEGEGSPSVATDRSGMTLPWPSTPHGFSMAEVFSGCGVLADAMQMRGFNTRKYDFALGGREHDISDIYTVT